jgi:hypothetical protein
MAVIQLERRKGSGMNDAATLRNLDARIAAIRDNIRQLVEQAAAYSGAADEARNADRIAAQEAKLEALLKEREALTGRA